MTTSSCAAYDAVRKEFTLVETPLPTHVPPHALLLRVECCALSHYDLMTISLRSIGSAADVPPSPPSPPSASTPTPPTTPASPGSGAGAGSSVLPSSTTPSSSPSTPPTPFGFEIAGVVTLLGSDVTGFEVEDSVVAALPAHSPPPCGDSSSSSSSSSCTRGCGQYVIVPALLVLKRPMLLSPHEAAACLLPGLRAFTALQYKFNWTDLAGSTALVTDAGSPFGVACVQLCGWMGAKVIAVTAVAEHRPVLADVSDDTVLRVLHPADDDVLQAVLNETGGLGVQLIIDGGGGVVAPWSSSSSSSSASPTPCVPPLTLIHALAVGGTLLVSHPDVTLDPPESKLLFYKSASLGFVFEQSWLLSPAQHGKYLHIMEEVLRLTAKRVLRQSVSAFPLDKVREAMRQLVEDTPGKGGRVVVDMPPMAARSTSDP